MLLLLITLILLFVNCVGTINNMPYRALDNSDNDRRTEALDDPFIEIIRNDTGQSVCAERRYEVVKQIDNVICIIKRYGMFMVYCKGYYYGPLTLDNDFIYVKQKEE